MLVNFDLLVVADRADFFAVAIDFLGFKSIHSIGRAEFADLKAGQHLRVADDEFPAQVNLDHCSKMFLVANFDFLLIANDAHVSRDNFGSEALDPVPRSQFANPQTGQPVRPGCDRCAIEKELSGLVFMVMRGVMHFCVIFGHSTSFKMDCSRWYTLISFHEVALQPVSDVPGQKRAQGNSHPLVTRKLVTRTKGGGR
jgi:hypothetical protein